MPLIRFVAVALVVLAFPAVCVAASATGNYAYDTSFEVAPPVSSDTDARTTASAHLDGTRTPPQVAEPSPASVPRGSTSSRTRGRATKAGRGGAGPVRLGQAGEDAVRGAYDIGPKATRVINGRTRIFDGLTTSTLSDVGNRRRPVGRLHLRRARPAADADRGLVDDAVPVCGRFAAAV